MQDDIKEAARVLNAGGLIIYPTDTIWGIGCDATKAEAVEKIYQLKKRDPKKSMLILVRDTFMAERYLSELPDIGIELFDAADKPLTLILEGAKNLATNLPADDGSIGIRIPDDPFCQGLLDRVRKPIVSTSANFSGKASPETFHDIDIDLQRAVDYVVSWKQDEAHNPEPSSIVSLRKNGQIKILRE